MPEITEILPLDSPLHEHLGRLQAIRQKPAHRSSGGMLVDGQTKFLSHRFADGFAQKHKELDLLLITDVQFGHRCCRVDKLKEYRDWILARENRFCFWGGDMVDAAHAGSPGATWENILNPQSQLYRFCEVMAPMTHRVLGFVGGNHERRAMAAGLELGALIAWVLGIPYSAGNQMISVYHGGHEPFKVFLWHGRGAARTPGGRVNMTLSAVPNDEADVYFSGHIHSAHAYQGWHLRRNFEKSRMEAKVYFVLSASSFMEFWGSYGEVQGFTFSDLMMPSARIHAEGSWQVIFKIPGSQPHKKPA